MPNFHHVALDHIKPWFAARKNLLLTTTGVTILLVFILVGGQYAYARTYQDKIYPGVSVGKINLGGFTQAEAAEILSSAYEEMIDQGLWVELAGENARLELRVVGSDDPDISYSLIDFDASAAAYGALSQGRQSSYWMNAWQSLWLPIAGKNIEPAFTLSEEKIIADLRVEFSVEETPGQITDFEINPKTENDMVGISITEGTVGRELETDEIIAAIASDVADFELETLELAMQDRPVEVSVEEATSLSGEVAAIIQLAPYALTYTGENKLDHEWTITALDLADWLEPIKDEAGIVSVGLNQEKLTEFFQTIHEEIDTEPIDAKFVISGNRVSEFQGSQSGITLDDEATMINLLSGLGRGGGDNIPVAVKLVEPNIATGTVNDLGVTEILGVGVSNFAGSPSNRIANIKHGASKLDGLLIAPGETASLLENLRPFTIEDGYLPELVIKGDEIKPEVGGGLCQIGTTTFRAVMNAGLEVVERRNHSLVVSYYNDPSNNKPGTDATIYDPSPDFKFKNNTENYILLTTEVDLDAKELHFTFWGTSDGRQGWYDAPTLISWTSAGEKVTKETTDLAPGQEKCQSAHPGASTTFDYHVKYADGTQFDQTFASTYRALPTICLVGVEKLSEPTTTGDTTESTETPATETEATTTTETETTTEETVTESTTTTE